MLKVLDCEIDPDLVLAMAALPSRLSQYQLAIPYETSSALMDNENFVLMANMPFLQWIV